MPSPAPRRGVPVVLIAILGAVLVAVGIGLGLFTQFGGANDEAANAAINDLLERRYNALVARELDAYMNTIDPARVFLRECATQRFQAYVRSDVLPQRLSVGRVEKWGSYFRVWLNTEYGALRTFMRYDGGRWYISEPFPRELGERLSKVYAGVKLHYQAADESLANVVGEDLVSIMSNVMTHAAEPPSALFELSIATLSDPGGECFVLGAAENWGMTNITLNDVRLTAEYDHISRDTAATIEHEALHWLQFDHGSRWKSAPSWWVIEGWPTLLSEPPSPSERRLAICTSPPSYDDLTYGLRPGAAVEHVADAYTVAAMLVERIVGASGDAAYWRFFDDFGGTTDPYLRATGSDGRSFYAAWLEDARRQYC